MGGGVIVFVVFVLVLFKIAAHVTQTVSDTRRRPIIVRRRKKKKLSPRDWDPIPQGWKPTVEDLTLDIESDQLDDIIAELDRKRKERDRILDEASERLEQAPPPLPVVTATAAATKEAPSGIATEVVATQVEIVEFCDKMFPNGYSTLESGKTFEREYVGVVVDWIGTLVGLDRYSYDFVLGNTPGLKAKIEIHRIENYGTSEVFVILGLPQEVEDALEKSLGQTIRFRGQLHKLDGLMRSVYATNGEIC